jgi:hypothetical protein
MPSSRRGWHPDQLDRWVGRRPGWPTYTKDLGLIRPLDSMVVELEKTIMDSNDMDDNQ